MKELLDEKRVRVEVEARGWREAVEAAGSLLVKEGLIETGFIASMIRTVEEMGPYMLLMPDVAFFHGPPGDQVKEACLSLITLKEPVYFHEFDGQRIVCAFAFGAKDASSHLEMLQQVAKLLQDEAFVRLIRGHGSKQEILDHIRNKEVLL